MSRRSAWRPIATALALCAAAVCQVGAGELAAVRVGLDGRYRVGVWSRVVVEFAPSSEAPAGRLELTVTDADGARNRYTQAVNDEQLFVRDGAYQVELYVRFGRMHDTLEAVFHKDGGGASRLEVSAGADDPQAPFATGISSASRLILEVGEPIGLEEVATRDAAASGAREVLARFSGIAGLPRSWLAYEGVDTVVVAGDPADLGPPDADLRELEALDEWVAWGGRLVLCFGRGAQAMADAANPWKRFLPGEVARIESLRRKGSIESYANTAFGAASDAALDVPRFHNPTGLIELAELDLPIILRSPRGFGEIIFVGLDLHEPPLARWPGRRQLVARLLAGSRPRAQDEPASGTVGAAARLGLTDLAGQLRGSLDQFEDVRAGSVLLVGGLLLAYVCLLGGAFLFLKPARRRAGIAWGWTASLVAIFTAVPVALAWRSRGPAVVINQADLVDVDVESGWIRGTSWFCVYSPDTSTYHFQFEPRPAAVHGDARPAAESRDRTEVCFGWMGLPGAALGGMDAETAPPALLARGYAAPRGLDALEGVPIQVASSRSFIGRWREQAPPPIEASLTRGAGADDVPEGRIESRLPFALDDCLLVYGDSAFVLDELRPQGAWTLRPGDHRSLATVLKDVRLVQEKRNVLVRVPTRYNIAGYDVPSILRQMTFYTAADGGMYTGLSNQYQHFVDLSRSLGLGRAVLFGVARDAPSAAELRGPELAGAGERGRRWVVYRFLIPVKMRD